MTTLRFTVTESDTAIALGSGDVPVLATPRLLAWLEAATVLAAAEQLAEGQTTVGTQVELRHRRATAVGRVVRVEVSRVERSGSRLLFEASAFEDEAIGGAAADTVDQPIATSHVTRAIVDRAAFVAALDHG